MKIGILIREYDSLKNWELRIIQEIINSETLELSLLIQDGRIGSENQKTLKVNSSVFISQKIFLGKSYLNYKY